MPEATFTEDDGELWIRDGEFYTHDRAKLCEALGCLAIIHDEQGIRALVAGKGWIAADEIAKTIGKPKLEAVK